MRKGPSCRTLGVLNAPEAGTVRAPRRRDWGHEVGR